MCYWGRSSNSWARWASVIRLSRSSCSGDSGEPEAAAFTAHRRVWQEGEDRSRWCMSRHTELGRQSAVSDMLAFRSWDGFLCFSALPGAAAMSFSSRSSPCAAFLSVSWPRFYLSALIRRFLAQAHVFSCGKMHFFSATKARPEIKHLGTARLTGRVRENKCAVIT